MSKTSISKGYMISMIIALINSLPALLTFIIVKNITNDLLISLVSSSVVFIIAIGFSIKFGKRLLK